MASSGSFNTNGYEGRYLTLSWSEKSQSVSANTTTISWTLKGAGSAQADWYMAGNFKVVIAGTTVYSSESRIKLFNGTVVASGSLTLTHNADGSKSFSASAEAGIYTYAVNCTGSKTFTLDTIPRASQPSCITWPEHTQNVGYFGDEISIHMNRKADTFTHTVRYAFGSQTGTIATGVTNGTTWTIPNSLMHLIPNNTSGSGTIYVDTYSGSTLVGTKYCGFTAKVPAEVVPAISYTLDDVNGMIDIYGSPVKGLSKMKIKVTGTPNYSSPIKSYKIIVDGVTYNKSEVTTSVLRIPSTINMSVTDARGRTTSTGVIMNVKDYFAPNITKLTVRRCNAAGVADDQGEYGLITFSAAVRGMSDKNTATYTLRCKKSSATTWATHTFTALTNTWDVTDHQHIITADSGSSYDIEIQVKDRHNTVIKSTSMSTAFTLMHWSEDGKRIGLLKMAENDGLDVGGDVYLNGHSLYGRQGMFDTRSTNETPQWYMSQGRGVMWEFKALKTVGFTSPAATYGPMQTIIPWGDTSGGLPRQVIYENRTRWTRIASSETTWGAWQSDALIAYPVGSVYIAYNHTDPSTLFGGTWVRITNAFLWAVDASGTIGQTGGEKEHTLTTREIPEHSHTIYVANTASGSTSANNRVRYNNDATSFAGNLSTAVAGGGQAHNNMPPYIQVSIWRRTA